jgi:H/ACA ribonucleoprotein complex subunit 3
MAKKAYLHGRPIDLSPSKVVGQGGEATIYRIDPARVLKLYLDPHDPQYTGDTQAQAGAQLRLDEQQRKLPAFPAGLSSRVTKPDSLAYDRPTGGRIVGYTMPYLTGMEVLLSLSDRKYRQAQGITENDVVATFRDLHAVVSGVHGASVVIGDFNDLNVLVSPKHEAFIVDADSMQFSGFPCRTFTARFVDPLHCYKDRLVLAVPHSRETDWYAFTTMLLQSLLFINPYYGGVHRPQTGKALRGDARVLHRKTVFAPDVIYPKVAVPLGNLPDALQEYFVNTYERDYRGMFPVTMLETLRWTTCSSCGLMHARGVCPGCVAPGVTKQVITKRGNVTVTRLRRTRGRILAVSTQGGVVRYVLFEDGAYRREDDSVVLRGEFDGTVRVRIWGDKTVLGKGSTLVVLAPDGTVERHETETVGRLPVFDANKDHLYRIAQGRLVRDGRHGDVHIGETLSGRTLLWVGDTFGFGFYRAGAITRGFVFNAHKGGLNDSVPLPSLVGNLIDATVTFADHLAWFMVSMQENGVIKHRCFVINDRGELVARTEANQGDTTWLGDGIRGHLAMGRSLYIATDTGIVRIGTSDGDVVPESAFPDTEPFVNTETTLLAGQGGIIAVSLRDIALLRIK